MNIPKTTILYVIAFVLISIIGFRVYMIKQQLIQINEHAPTQSEATHIYDYLLLNQR